MYKRYLQNLVMIFLLMQAGISYAHVFAPALLEVVEFQKNASAAPDKTLKTSTQRYRIKWKTPLKQPPNSRLIPVLPAHCKPLEKTRIQIQGTARLMQWHVDCGEKGLLNQTLGADGIASSGATVIVRVQLLDGRHYQAVLEASDSRFTVPEKAQVFAVITEYGLLGVEHLWFGFDHLLFVLSLVLLMGFNRTLLFAITGFTLGHSVTLSLAALQIIYFPQDLAEILIALSLVAVAAEMSHRDKTPGLISRFPIALTLLLGMVHGLGFAGALQAIGLPQEAIVQALLAFNIGIELAQLMVILGLWLGYLLLNKYFKKWLSYASSKEHSLNGRLSLVVPIGVLAAFWFWQRVAGL